MAVKGFGTLLAYGDTANYATAATWTPLARVNNVKPPKVGQKDIDTTTLDSPDEFEEVIPGLANGGELEANIEYDKTRTQTLFGFFRVVKAYRVLYPDGSGWKLNGYLSEIGDDEVQKGDIIRTTVKIKVTGKPVPFATVS